MSAFSEIASWPVDTVAGALLKDGELHETVGDTSQVFAVASVTKPVVAYAIMLAVEEGAIELDTPAGPEGSTLRHLLAHTSGVGFDSREQEREVGERRIYSSAGYEWAAEVVEEATGIEFRDYLQEGLLDPLGMKDTYLGDSPGHSLRTSVDDLAKFAAEVQNPQLLHPTTVEEMRTVQFEGLRGIVPGYGSHNPCDWGLGFELRGDKGDKGKHWTGTTMPPETAGHFGMSGTFLWLAGNWAMIALTDEDFGPWAKPLWNEANTAIWDELNA